MLLNTWNQDSQPGPTLTQQSTQCVLEEDLLNGQMDDLPQRQPSPSRNSQGDISHQLQFSGAVFVTDSWIWSYTLRKSPLAHKGPCIFCKAKLPRSGLLPPLLLPTSWLSLDHSLVLLTLYFILQVSAELRGQYHVLLKTRKCLSAQDKGNGLHLRGLLVFPWVLFTKGEISYWN